MTQSEVINMHNLHECALQNPHATLRSSFQQKLSVNVWAKTTEDYLTGPYVKRIFSVESSALISLKEHFCLRMFARARVFTRRHPFPLFKWLNNHFPETWTIHVGPIIWHVFLIRVHFTSSHTDATNETFKLRKCKGRVTAQAVSRRLPTAAAWIRAQVRTCGICGGQSGAGENFLRVLRFHLPILNPPTAPHSSSFIIRGWYNKPISGRRTKWTESHPTPRN
jgi:hypothetical protein